MSYHGIQIQTTCSSEAEAEKIARELLAMRLVACAQVTGPITSHYHWAGKRETSQEWLCLMKTDRALFPTVQAEIQKLHSYEVPQIIALPIIEGNAAYMQWLADQVKKERE